MEPPGKPRKSYARKRAASERVVFRALGREQGRPEAGRAAKEGDTQDTAEPRKRGEPRTCVVGMATPETARGRLEGGRQAHFSRPAEGGALGGPVGDRGCSVSGALSFRQ